MATTILLVGPSGSGKSTRIAEVYREELFAGDRNMYIHICRDIINNSIIRQAGYDPRTSQEQSVLSKLLANNLTEYTQRLEDALAKPYCDILIDVTSSSNTGWVFDTIKASRSAGHHIVVEALHADPAQTLKRVLQRDTSNMTYEQAQDSHMLNPNREHFRNWLNSHKVMPDLLASLVSQADHTRLFDGMGNPLYPKVVAEWKNGQTTLHCSESYQRFQSLRDINLDGASFHVQFSAAAKTHRPVARHQFDLAIHDFYLDTPSAVDRPLPTTSSSKSVPSSSYA